MSAGAPRPTAARASAEDPPRYDSAMSSSVQQPSSSEAESHAVFASAAELFAVLATPLRLKLISALCHGEKNVSQLLQEITATQPNLSQHLSTLYRAGILARRRAGTQIFYRLQSERAAMLCRAVCLQIATEMDTDVPLPESERLLPALRRA